MRNLLPILVLLGALQDPIAAKRSNAISLSSLRRDLTFLQSITVQDNPISDPNADHVALKELEDPNIVEIQSKDSIFQGGDYKDDVDHINDYIRATYRTSKISGGQYEEVRFTKIAHNLPNRFKYRWTNFTYVTDRYKVTPGHDNIFEDDHDLNVKLPPARLSTVRGLMVGDVCLSSRYIICSYSKAYGLLAKLTWTLDQLRTSNALDFWALLGDNFYDETGFISNTFVNKLSKPVMATPLYAVVGNHDLWTKGDPSMGVNNQFGYGHMQFYFMDPATEKENYSTSPFDFTVNPNDENRDTPLPLVKNFFHYSSVGSAGFIVFSGAHDLDMALFNEACNYFAPGQPGGHVSFLFLLGHWSDENMGCKPEMASSQLLAVMSDSEGAFKGNFCHKLTQEERVYYVEGHHHENRLMSKFGIRVGANGMFDTGMFGLPLFEVQDAEDFMQFKMIYIPLAKYALDSRVDHRFAKVQACADKKDFYECVTTLPFAETWIEHRITKKSKLKVE